jgi:hypothetical protein
MCENCVLALLDGRKIEEARPVHNGLLGGPGDLLYVRESWMAAHRRRDNALQVIYRVDGRQVYLTVPDGKAVRLRDTWRSSLHMPQFMARLWLRIDEVVSQHLQEIDPEGAIRRGIFQGADDGLWRFGPDDLGFDDPVMAYGDLWDGTHGKDPILCWEANPQVEVTRFTVIRDDPYDLIAEA